MEGSVETAVVDELYKFLFNFGAAVIFYSVVVALIVEACSMTRIRYYRIQENLLFWLTRSAFDNQSFETSLNIASVSKEALFKMSISELCGQISAMLYQELEFIAEKLRGYEKFKEENEDGIEGEEIDWPDVVSNDCTDIKAALLLNILAAKRGNFKWDESSNRRFIEEYIKDLAKSEDARSKLSELTNLIDRTIDDLLTTLEDKLKKEQLYFSVVISLLILFLLVPASSIITSASFTDFILGLPVAILAGTFAPILRGFVKSRLV